MSKSTEAVKYMISVWDEVAGNWRERPDHVAQKFLEAEKELEAEETTFEFGDSFKLRCRATEEGLVINKVSYNGRDVINILPDASNQIIIK